MAHLSVAQTPVDAGRIVDVPGLCTPGVNKRGHVANAVLLSIGVAVLLEGRLTVPTPTAVAAVGMPITLGALFPDIDTSFGTHRKTFHNVATLGAFVAFPLVFGNLHYVWIGVATHYVLDLLGNIRGMALLYPYPEEYDIPVGVAVASRWSDAVTLAVTGVELTAIALVLHTGAHEPVLDVIATYL